MNKKQKGFTLVELLVVIAIVAILATVSVVGYLSFTSKAKVSNDISLTKQMNNILLGDTALEGKNNTADDAVKDLQEQGLDVTKMTPTKEGYEFVYDLGQDKFFLLDETGKQIAPEDSKVNTETNNVYKFVGKDGTLSDKYANYLKADYVSSGTETISTGFDAGENTTVTTLNYNNNTARTSTIRTNGGTLNVNAPLDVVNHYGISDNVNIEAVDNNSYHEYGNVAFALTLKSGHLELESESMVTELFIPATSTDSTVDLQANSLVKNVISESDKANIKLNEGSKINNYTGNKSNLNGVGLNNVSYVEKTIVSNEKELNDALQKKAKYILFANDITTKTKPGIAITYDVLIDGQNHNLISETDRCIWLAGNNINAVIKNLVVSSTVGGSRGIQINSPEDKVSYYTGNDLKLFNVTVKNIAHYAVNVTAKVEAKLTITKCNLTGYSALNLWNKNFEVRVTDSILKGVNATSYDPSQLNDFGTIVLAGDWTNTITSHAGMINIEISNSEIIASSLHGNKQAIFNFQDNSVLNKVKLQKTKLTLEGEGAFKINDSGMHNQLIIDGENVPTSMVDNKNISCDFSGLTFADDGLSATGVAKILLNNKEYLINLDDTYKDPFKGTYYCFDIIQDKYVLKCNIYVSKGIHGPEQICVLSASDYIR